MVRETGLSGRRLVPLGRRLPAANIIKNYLTGLRRRPVSTSSPHPFVRRYRLPASAVPPAHAGNAGIFALSLTSTFDRMAAEPGWKLSPESRQALLNSPRPKILHRRDG